MKAFSTQAEASIAGLQLPVESIQSMVYKLLQRRLWELFELPCAWITHDNRNTALMLIFGEPSQQQFDQTLVKYPHGFLRLGDVDDDTLRGNIHYMSSKGFRVVPDTNERRAMHVKVVPTKSRVTLEYVTNDFRSLQNFLATLIHARRRRWISFNVQYGRTVFNVYSVFYGSVPIPQRTVTGENQSEYLLEIQLDVHGFTNMPILTEQQYVEDTNITASIDKDSKDPNAVFWSWRTERTDDRQRVLNQSNRLA